MSLVSVPFHLRPLRTLPKNVGHTESGGKMPPGQNASQKKMPPGKNAS